MADNQDKEQDLFAELGQAESAAPASSAVAEGKKDIKKRGKKKAVRHIPVGNAYIKATYNNTIVTFTDVQGNVLAQSSAGRLGFKGPKKSTPYAASLIVKDASEKVKKYGLMEVSVFVRGIASGREGALRALNTCGMSINSLKDVTPIPHNGCRPRKVRRV
ncbi:30S ribosomal protein S11 [Candidatus Uhrbacteria bacterium]|nr:30S ribosomal protein S11 [Candidatus Uhrbacteria bacterium]